MKLNISSFKKINSYIDSKGFREKSNRIAELRKAEGFSQNEVAEALGTTRQAISYYETGKREPKMETWQKLAKIFSVSVPYLQGLTFSFADILELLHKTYFDEYLNDFDTIVTPVRVYTRIKSIPLPEKYLTNKEDQTNFTNKSAKYWAKNFLFIFGYSPVYTLLSVPNNKNFVENAKENITEAIEKECLRLSATPISKQFNDDCATNFLRFSDDKDALLRLGSKSEIKKRVDSLINSLSTFRNNLDSLPKNENKYHLDYEDFS